MYFHLLYITGIPVFYCMGMDGNEWEWMGIMGIMGVMGIMKKIPLMKTSTGFLESRGDRTRTCDSLVPNQERYQLRYTSDAFFICGCKGNHFD